jgi:hypothetical protein
MNKDSYVKLIEQDIKQLDSAFEKGSIYKLECEHIKQVLNWSINQIYPPSKWYPDYKRKYGKEIINDDEIDLMTISEFNDFSSWCNLDDGTGYWVRDGFRSDDEVFNSEQLDATHVVWYNK